MEKYISSLQGIVVPVSRVDYLAWTVTIENAVKVTVDFSDEGPVFNLKQSRTYHFNNNLYRVGSEVPILVESSVFGTTPSVEPLFKSELFTSMTEKSTKALQEVLTSIVRLYNKVEQSTKLLENLNQVVSDEDNPAIKEHRKKLRIRQRKLNEAYGDLISFEEKKSSIICDNVSIPEARKFPEWTDDVEKYFLSVLEEDLSEYETVNMSNIHDDEDDDDDDEDDNNNEEDDNDNDDEKSKVDSEISEAVS